jgi:hypothetical protein
MYLIAVMAVVNISETSADYTTQHPRKQLIISVIF